jgi:hypothetical protein
VYARGIGVLRRGAGAGPDRVSPTVEGVLRPAAPSASRRSTVVPPQADRSASSRLDRDAITYTCRTMQPPGGQTGSSRHLAARWRGLP